ncbi:ankyrin repeat-containing domain protein, partial [Russula brevipes]
TEIRNWLSPPDYSINHRTARDKQHEGTTKWFIEDRRFKEWRVNGSLLWICGNRMLALPSDPSLIAYHYFDFKDATKCDFRGLLSSLLFQLADNSERCWGVLRALFSQCEDGVEPPSDTDLTRCLESMVQCSEKIPIYLLIDALDECPDISGTPSAREKVLKFVEDLVSLNQSNLFICITSRPEQDIRNVLDHLTPTSRLVPLHEERGQTEDISGYIRSFVYGDRKMRRWRTEDKELVINSLSNRAHGMFRWVVCQLDTLRRCVPASLGKTLNELPTTLDDTYQRALQGIPTSNDITHIAFSKLAEVFAVEFEGTAPNFMEGWRPENPEEAVLSACSTLVTIVSSEDLRIVQFSHFSVKEFLTSHRLQAYGGRLEKFPLALYAGQNWVDHAKMKDVASRIQDAMKRLFTPSEPYLAAWAVRVLLRHHADPNTKNRYERTPLYVAFDLKRYEVMRLLLEHGADTDMSYDLDQRLLHSVSGLGDVNAGRLLLKHGADANARDSSGWTPLHWASISGHQEVVELLLESRADINARSKLQMTPLHLASEHNHPEVVSLLLESGANVNASSTIQIIPLHLASKHGHLKVVRLLLASGANVNASSTTQMTPLHFASKHGHPEVVHLLLDSGADINAPSSTTQANPLHLASEHGHPEVVSLLLESGAVVNAVSTTQTIALHLASEQGHLKVVSLLLESGANVNASPKTQITALHLASERGHLEVVSLLLESGA